VTAENAAPGPAHPRLVASGPAGERTGTVVSVRLGVVHVVGEAGPVRASLGADLLARIAQDPSAAPRRGDRVLMRTWADGPVTVEEVLRRVP